MQLRVKTVIAVLLLGILSGCGGIKFTEPREPNMSIIIGAIDMGDASGKFTNVVMRQIKPVTDKPFYHFAIKDGMFFRTQTPAGIYKMDNFSSFNSWTNTRYTYNFPKSGRGEMDLKISKPGIYYVGSWKYKKVKVGFKKWIMGEGKFDLERVQSPTELEILQKIRVHSKHDYWTNMIDKRIAVLQRGESRKVSKK